MKLTEVLDWQKHDCLHTCCSMFAGCPTAVPCLQCSAIQLLCEQLPVSPSEAKCAAHLLQLQVPEPKHVGNACGWSSSKSSSTVHIGATPVAENLMDV